MTQAVTYQDLTGTHAHHSSRSYSESSSLIELLQRPEWQERAACRGMGPTDWFPSRGDSRLESTQRAKAICAGCPVSDECLQFSLSAHPLDGGIWSGLSEKQRKWMRVGDPRYVHDRRLHGTVSRYNDGCRCVACKRANAEFRARSRTRSKRNRLRAKGAA